MKALSSVTTDSFFAVHYVHVHVSVSRRKTQDSLSRAAHRRLEMTTFAVGFVVCSIPQRLPRLERELNPLLRFLFSAQRFEGLTFQIQDVLLADRGSRG